MNDGALRAVKKLYVRRLCAARDKWQRGNRLYHDRQYVHSQRCSARINTSLFAGSDIASRGVVRSGDWRCAHIQGYYTDDGSCHGVEESVDIGRGR
jgi:hypothetical protein